MSAPADDLALAHALADAADEITLARFGAVDLAVRSKPDRTPVSDADVAAERAIRALVAARRPGDAVLGEEDGAGDAAALDRPGDDAASDPPGHPARGDRGQARPGGRRWIVDPIDGTKNYVRGVPVWATVIGLHVDGEPTVGVVSAPALGRRWWAAVGLGAHTGGRLSAARRLAVSQVDKLSEASLSYSSLSGWAAGGRLPGVLRLAETAWRTRAYGDFWSHVLVAEGAVDASFEPEVSLWDIAGLQVILQEAGGRFTDLSGAPTADGGSVVCSNGLLHEQVLDALRVAA